MQRAMDSSSYHRAAVSAAASQQRPYSEESWVEVPSRPSSSSLSSAATDEIVTTGLRVDNIVNVKPRRRPRRQQQQQQRQQSTSSSAPAFGPDQRQPSFNGSNSSQEEYEESESEEDRAADIVAAASFNDLEPHSSSAEEIDDADADDDDGNATALGVAMPDVFTPQPHAFSPPPSHVTNRHQMHRDSYFPRTSASDTVRSPPRRSFSQPHPQPTTQHSPFSALSTTHQPDHDAALRASLTTLLSCAAAARGLPKQAHRSSSSTQARAAPSPPLRARVEPGPLRIVSESALMEERASASISPSSSSPPSEKHKRKAPTSKAQQQKDQTRAAKKAKRTSITPVTDDALASISPTLLTWVVSAGVVVLFSAIGFSAGYAMGREVGRAEMSGSMGNVGEGGACGREAVRGGLRRLRWGTGGAGAVRA